ncbi:MAG: hypothetical protein M5R40_10545 [Anaerolineae bacterium]|nr:hypothetical protein [Anaerolineae bacterium]
MKVLLRRVNPRRRQLVVAEVDLRKRAFPVEVLAMTRDAVHIMLRFEVLYQVAQSTNEKPATDILNVHDPLCQLHAFVTDAAFFAARTCTYADLLRSNGTNSDPLKKICCDVAERLKCCSTHIGLTVHRVLLEGIYPVTF